MILWLATSLFSTRFGVVENWFCASVPSSSFWRLRSVWIVCFILLVLVVIGVYVGVQYISSMPGKSYSGPTRPLDPEETKVRAGLIKNVEELAGQIGERHVGRYKALEAAADYLANTFGELGYTVNSQPFEAHGRTVRNIEVELAGQTLTEEIVVVGAHYDTVTASPGANDNASGVAGVLEIARLLAGRKLDRTVRFLAFVNEEQPFFQTSKMGSRVYARRCAERREKIVAMLSIETIGHYSDEKGSQEYPSPLSNLYPDTGNFIGFVGNASSRELLHRVVGSFRKHTEFPSEGICAPESIQGVGWSDHWSFWQEDYPAIMVTDTAFYRYGYYHTPGDTPEKIDYDRTARVVVGLGRIVVDLASADSK